MDIIETKNAPAAIGPYSQAIAAGQLVFTSGQFPFIPETGILIEGAISEQAEQVLKNLSAVLQAAGCGLEDVVKTTCFLQSMNDFAAFNAVYETYFTAKPARSCVEVSALPKGSLVGIEAIAIRKG